MTLKRKLTIVVVVVILAPMILMGTIIYLQNQQGLQRTTFDSRMVSLFYLRTLEQKVEEANPTLPLTSLVGTQILVAPDNSIIASNTPGLGVGQSWIPRQDSPLIGDIFAFPLKNGNILIQIFPDSFFLSDRQSFLHIFQVPLIVAIVFIIFLALMILHSINNSVIRLSAAMERVASGDLDYQDPLMEKNDLGQLGKAYESMRRALKEEKARLSRFLLGVSHDLKTPLASIRGYLEALSDGFDDTPEKRREFLGIMDQKAQILQSRITSLIELMKMSTQEWRIRQNPLELGEWLNNFSTALSQEGLITGKILVPKGKGLPRLTLSLDPELLERVLENLIQNAFRHGQAHTPVNIEWVFSPQEAQISVVNQGIEIQEQNKDRIFEPFFKEDSGRNTPGSGLGLASVRHICDANGWKLDWHSKEGQTRFTLILEV